MDAMLENKYIENLAQGDQFSFDMLFLHYYPKLKVFISNLIKNEEDARDLAQDIFLTIWSNQTKLLEITSFKAYVFKMAKNSIYDYYKRHTVFVHDFSPISETFIADIHSISDSIEAKDLALLIDIAIENMPTQRRNVFNMSRKEGLSNEQIATQLNISKRTVETHISNTLKDIRKMLTSVVLFFI